jgi:AmmeMemoRadiSam system protein B
VAGSFYPARRDELEREVRGLLAAARDAAETGWSAEGAPPAAGPPDLAGLIVPHAGYRYSGPVAAAGYVRLAAARSRPSHLAVLGPSHFVALRGMAVPPMDAWETPMGRVSVDPELRSTAVAAGARQDDGPHGPEHATEVQLPFLQAVCPGVPVLPVAVGDVDPGPVADLIGRVVSVPGTVVIVSTDLSHYLDLARARVADERTARAIEARDPAAIGAHDACGATALRGFLEWAARGGLAVRRLRLATSADTAGEPGRVVGYGAFALEAGRVDRRSVGPGPP